MEKKKALSRLLIFIGLELLAVALVVVVFDPFYQYHGPLPGMASVLYDRDNQVAGSVRNFQYDAVLLGSSVSENFDTDFIDANFDCRTLKVIRGGSGVSDLLYYLNMAREKHDIKHVFWCMDLFALDAVPEVTLTRETAPYYLHTKSVLDDIPYLFNKEVLLEKIPYMVANERLGIHTGGHAYDWSEGKQFGAEFAMISYEKPEWSTKEGRKAALADRTRVPKEQVPNLEENYAMVLEEIQGHPDTTYTVFFPPYSLLWWDFWYVNGRAEEYFTIIETVLPALAACDNVELYYFQHERDIVCNLDYYMDLNHYSPEINQYMLDCILSGQNLVTPDNVSEYIEQMRETYEYIVEEGIFSYYPE